MNPRSRPVRAGLSRIRVLNLREIRAHRLRVVTALTVVAVASALLVAVLGAYGSMTESVRQVNAAISGAAQVEVASTADTGIDQSLAGEIRANVPDAKSVVPMIRDSVVVGDRTIALLGSDFRVTALSGELRGAVAGQSAGLNQQDLQDGIIVGAATGLREGQTLSVNGIDVRVLSVVDGPQSAVLNGGDFAFAYLGLAQRLLSRGDTIDSILIAAEPGADLLAVRSQVGRVVGGRAAVLDPDFRVEAAEAAGSVTRDATLLVSLISLVIAGFLVFNTMNMAVASRRQSLAMMRALGARRGHLVGDLLGESALLGLVGGLVGLPIGVLAGRWAIGRIPSTSSDPMAGVISYHLPLYAPMVAVIACVVACVAATGLAARSAFAVAPIEAMSAGDVADGTEGRRGFRWLAGTAGVGLLIGSWLIATTVHDRVAVVAGLVFAVGALLLCFAAATPLVRAVVALARRLGGPGQLAAVNTDRAPRRVWATSMTVAVAVTVGLGTSGALDNMVSSIASSLDGLSDPDFYVASSEPGAVPKGPVLPSAIASEAATVPGVREVVGAQWASVAVGDARILLQGLEPNSLAPFMRKANPTAVHQVLAGDGILMSNALARTMGVRIGDTLTLATPVGYRGLVVRDTVDYLAIGSGAAAMSNSLMSTWFDDRGDTYLQVMTETGADTDQVRAGLEKIAAAHPSVGDKPVDVYSGAEALAATEASVRQAGAFTMAIQWIVAVAAAVALLNTLLLSVLERRRELGVLRAMGASRRFVSRMVMAEAAATAVVGSVLGVVMGTALHLLSDKILAATTSVEIQFSPTPSTLVFVAAACALCVVGAAVPARRASRMNISESILAE